MMASQSLYRKWRSQTFSDLLGQEAVVRTLLNAVRDGRLAHAYLFSGPRGTGKTSMARLLAKAVNCERPRDGEPCNECVSCTEIAAGRSPDVIEIDAASNNGVGDIRGLRENANLMGSGGHYKVYIIDEAHMLTPQAWNAFLKTLEEPPPHIIFVFATTEAHKVLPTVVSRCQRFDFHRIRMNVIVARLKQVAAGEGLTLEPAAADLLARAAQGGLRDALSLLDQAVAFCGERIDLEATRVMLGLADVGALRRLITCVADNRPADALDLLNELVTTGADLRQLNSQFADEWRALMLTRAGADLTHVMDYTDEEARELEALAGRFSLDALMACARVFARNEGPAHGLPVPQLALELSLLECLSVCHRQAQPAPAPTTEAPHPPRPTQVAPAPAQPPVAAAAPVRARPAPHPQVEELDLAAIDAGTWAGPASVGQVEPHAPSAAPTPPPAYTPSEADEEATAPAMQWSEPESDDSAGGRDWVEEAQRSWSLIRKICRQKPPMGAVVGGLLSAADPIRVEPGEPVTLVIRTKFDVHLTKLREPGMREVVEWALEQALSAPLRVHFVPPNEPQRGTAQTRQRSAAGGTSVVGPAAVAQAATTQQPQVYERGAQTRARAVSGSASGGEPAPESSAPRGHSPGNGHHPPGPQEGKKQVNGRAEIRERPAPAQPARNLEQAAREDPVVQEFARMLKTEVAEVRPLDAPEPDDY